MTFAVKLDSEEKVTSEYGSIIPNGRNNYYGLLWEFLGSFTERIRPVDKHKKTAIHLAKGQFVHQGFLYTYIENMDLSHFSFAVAVINCIIHELCLYDANLKFTSIKSKYETCSSS